MDYQSILKVLSPRGEMRMYQSTEINISGTSNFLVNNYGVLPLCKSVTSLRLEHIPGGRRTDDPIGEEYCVEKYTLLSSAFKKGLVDVPRLYLKNFDFDRLIELGWSGENLEVLVLFEDWSYGNGLTAVARNAKLLEDVRLINCPLMFRWTEEESSEFFLSCQNLTRFEISNEYIQGDHPEFGPNHFRCMSPGMKNLNLQGAAMDLTHYGPPPDQLPTFLDLGNFSCNGHSTSLEDIEKVLKNCPNLVHITITHPQLAVVPSQSIWERFLKSVVEKHRHLGSLHLLSFGQGKNFSSSCISVTKAMEQFMVRNSVELVVDRGFQPPY
jgi:hypothetical protein